MKRKVKRYSAGDQVEGDYESSDDAKNLIAAAAREKADYEASQSKMPNVGEPLKMASFGEAFKEARGRGDKTFEYMGKKYTTEMAGAKKPAAPATAKTAFEKRAAKQTAARTARAASSEERKSRPMGQMSDVIGAKKGGMVGSASKRADGIAQRGKTRGRII
jgi:hypothetical protein